MAHLPFGEDFAESGTQEKHHFTSYERDNESGSDYSVNRQKALDVGRFMRVDPYGGSYDAGNPQSINRYAYVENDPVNKIDPLGLIAYVFPPGPQVPPIFNAGSTVVFANPDPVGLPGAGRGGDSTSKLRRWTRKPNQVNRALRLINENYDKCRQAVFGSATGYGSPGHEKSIPDQLASVWILVAGGFESEIVALVSAIWAKESNYTWFPTGDQGPMQLTSWWRENYGGLILSGAYDPFTRPNCEQNPRGCIRRTWNFTGDPFANIVSGGNILAFLYDQNNGDVSKAAARYHGGGDQSAYANEVMDWYGKSKQFFDCIRTGNVP